MTVTILMSFRDLGCNIGFFPGELCEWHLTLLTETLKTQLQRQVIFNSFENL